MHCTDGVRVLIRSDVHALALRDIGGAKGLVVGLSNWADAAAAGESTMMAARSLSPLVTGSRTYSARRRYRYTFVVGLRSRSSRR